MRKRFLAAAVSMSMAVTMLPAVAFADEAGSEGTSVESQTEESEDGSEAETEAQEEAFDYGEGLDEKGFFEGISALDYVTLPDYTKVVLDKSEVEPTDEVIEAAIAELLKQYATTEQITDEDRLAEDGDTVNIDYVGSMDGVEFDGGKDSGYDLVLGSGSFIDGFEEQLVGHAPGENFDITVTFPDPYTNNPDMSGKEAVFNITINHIKETTIPEFDDDFVAENLSDYESAEAYRQYIFDTNKEQNQGNALLEYLISGAQVSEVPEEAAETIYRQRYQYYAEMASMYGMTADDLLGIYGLTADSFREMCNAYASNYLVILAIMEQEGWIVDSDTAMELLGVDEDEYAEYVDFYGEPYIFFSECVDLVIRDLADRVELAEVEDEESSSEVEGEESETASQEESPSEEE